VIGGLIDAFVRGLTRNTAVTSPDAEDPRLLGRTYAIPFEEVWRASLDLVDGGLPRWELVEADDQEGLIRGVAHGRMERFTSDITLRITLDRDAQTRVDATAASRVGRADLGANARRLHRYFTTLDRRIGEDNGRAIESFRLDAAHAGARP
jgi:uncharacterized protein (DUF1499 family)